MSDARFLSCLLKNRRIGNTLKAFFSQVNDLVSLLAERLHGGNRDTHVRQESHERDPAVW